MLGAISGIHAYSSQYTYNNPYLTGRAGQSAQAEGAQQAGGVTAAHRASNLETPVEPVRPATAVDSNEASTANLGLPIRQGADPVEMAVRMRIRYDTPAAPEQAEPEAAAGTEAIQKAVEEGECQTCSQRKYQDGSDDMGVSFQTPTHIDPDQAAATVRGHEQEHVVREQAQAQREDRKVLSQSVVLHTSICPECGRAYVSGGVTRTVTAAEGQQVQQQNAQEQAQRTPFSAVA